MWRRIGIAGVIGLLLAGVAFLVLRNDEPTYQNRRISLILDDWAAGRQGVPEDKALSVIGTNALPYVIRHLIRNDSSWRRKFRDTWLKLPNSLQKILPQPKPDLDVLNGGTAFFYIGPGAIPQASALLRHNSPSVRAAAAVGLFSLRKRFREAGMAIPALTETLRDPKPLIRVYAARALAEMGADASNAVPALAKVAADPRVGSLAITTFALRGTAVTALGRIGPAAKAAIPALKTMLQEQTAEPTLRGSAALAIWRIDEDVDTTLPVFLQEMPLTGEINKGGWIIALGEMGPRARAAIPQLERELSQDKVSWILESVTNALLKIDREAAAKAGVFPAAAKE
jgi:HEAT repeat protein